MITPRPYLSFSQMSTFEMSKEKFKEQYLYGHKQRISKNMAYGSKMADGLENEEATGDVVLDMMMAKIPKFELMDKPIEDKKGKEIEYSRGKKPIKVKVPTLYVDGKNDIPLLAFPDTAKKDDTAFKEYKTSVRKWTQKMADDSGQITFYTTCYWLKTGKLPEDIELVNVQVEYAEDGSIRPTGEMWRYKTTRTMVDVIKMTSRIKKAWRGIKELCEEELL